VPDRTARGENAADATGGRRPLASRSTAWAGALAAFLARAGVAPNAISAASVVFALAAAAGILLAPGAEGWAARSLWIGGAAGIQLRLLCNLMDGMVAVEGGRKSACGDLWNEIPDRIADAAVLLAAGVAAGFAWLGVAAAIGAVLTAYLRAFGAALTGLHDFRGPMAKPHRMATLTAACLAAAVLPCAGPAILAVATGVIVAGIVVTCWRRTALLAERLRERQS